MEGVGGGAGRDRLRNVGEESLGSTPLPQPRPPPTTPFPIHTTWSTLGQSQLDKSSPTARA